MRQSLVIFLHGVGSRGADLAPLASAWRAILPQTRFAAPDGPFPFDQGGPGRQWFSVRGVTDFNRPQRVADAREMFDATVMKVASDHGLADTPERIALVGFSQGAIMALDIAASGRWPIAGVVAFSGRLASPPPYVPSQATPILLIHGTADPIMPPIESEKAEIALTAIGHTVRRHMLPGLGHTISTTGADIASRFLADVLQVGHNGEGP